MSQGFMMVAELATYRVPEDPTSLVFMSIMVWNCTT
jgi:hypothetical protein